MSHFLFFFIDIHAFDPTGGTYGQNKNIGKRTKEKRKALRKIAKKLVRHPAVFIVHSEYDEPCASHVLVTSSPSLSKISASADDWTAFKDAPIEWVREPFTQEVESGEVAKDVKSITVNPSLKDFESLLKDGKIYLGTTRFQVLTRLKARARIAVSHLG